MSVEIIQYEAGQSEEWDAFVHQSDTVSQFHKYKFRLVVEQTFGHRPI